jgi:hypothetical protein
MKKIIFTTIICAILITGLYSVRAGSIALNSGGSIAIKANGNLYFANKFPSTTRQCFDVGHIHSITSVDFNPGGRYQNQLDLLKKNNINCVRVNIIALTGDLTQYKQMATTAESQGFYVSWGAGLNSNPQSSSTVSTYLASLDSLVSFFQNNHIDEWILCNECEYDLGNDIATTTFQQELNWKAGILKGEGYTGKISMNTEQLQIDNWAVLDTTNLDYLGFNIYGGFSGTCPNLALFVCAVQDLASQFPTKGYISEWSSGLGIDNFGGYEPSWASYIQQEINTILQNNIPRETFFTLWSDQYPNWERWALVYDNGSGNPPTYFYKALNVVGLSP